ncbi:MAG: DUF1836 domain-containing protein [Clostridiaceae bacterium]|jgi:hypothetical protein|nr:DUF1836 domain-containing protein [Clostridiaceae bacterium]
MEAIKKILLEWVEELEEYHMPGWSELPDLDLYMDQVITYLERQLSIFSKSSEEKLITPSMINNYAKNEIIPRPVQKKYTRDHMAHLISVLNLKNILSLMEIARLISHETSDKPIDTFYNRLIKIQDEAIKSTATRVKESFLSLETETDKTDQEKLGLLALKFSLEANACRIAAKKIIEELETKTDSPQQAEIRDKANSNNRDTAK